MNETLYERIINAGFNESFKDIFSSLNLYYGYKNIDEIDCSEEVRQGVVRYVAEMYSYEHPNVRNSKNRLEERKLCLQKNNLIFTNDLTQEIFKNQQPQVQRFIAFWLDETQHPLWAKVVTGWDLEAELLQVARTGLDVKLVTDDPKVLDKFAKQMKKDYGIKTQAFIDAGKIRIQCDEFLLKLEKMGYGKLEQILKKEVPEYFNGEEDYASMLSKRRRAAMPASSHLKIA